MTTVVAVGAQWGDEGKGKIVDWPNVQNSKILHPIYTPGSSAETFAALLF